MLSNLRTITINNYKSTNCSITKVQTFRNILFLKQQIDKPFMSIITDQTNYIVIKDILIKLLNINDIFTELEKHGFNSFSPYASQNKTVKHLLNTKYNYLLTDNKQCTLFKICANYQSPIFTKSSKTILHEGVLKCLQIINGEMFVPFTIFDDMCNDLTLYNTDSYLKNILISNSNMNNKIITLLCNLSIVVINSLSEFLGISVKNLSIDLILYMSPTIKICPTTDTEPMSYEHVNSGSTIYYHDLNYADPLIKIYRTEELVKVLFHELIHAAKFDQLFDDYPDHTFKVTRKQLLFTESLTECLARIVNIILYSHIYNKNFNETFNEELDFSLVQTAKILNNYGFRSVNDFINNDTNDKRKIKQKTSAFEYYILTGLLLFKINDFLDIIKSKDNIQKVVILINDTLNSDDYQNKVNDKIKNINNMHISEKKTCKMTKIKIDLNNVVNYDKYKSKYLNYKINLIK